MFKALAAFTGALVLVGSAAALAEVRAAAVHTKAQVALEKEAVDLLESMEEVGADVHFHAERLAHYIQNPTISVWSHDHHLEAIKTLVNEEVGPGLKRLKEIQAQLPEWKQGSVDRMEASARALASDASSAFVARTAKAPIAMNEDYKKFVIGMEAHAEALSKTAEEAVNFGAAHLKASEAEVNGQK